MSLSLCSLRLSARFLSAHALIGSLFCFFLSHSNPAAQGLMPDHIQVFTLLVPKVVVKAAVYALR